MPAITSLGIGSGLDINGMVSQLVALERKPLDAMRAEATRLQTQVSAYGKISSLFSGLRDASDKLAGTAPWAATTATSSQPDAVAVSGGSGAAAGRYAVQVQALAAGQTVASAAALTDAAGLVGAGTLTLDLGRWDGSSFSPRGSPVTLEIGAGDTLATLRDRINGLGAGVSASLVTDASGVRLSLRSTATGADNGFRLAVSDADGNAGDAAGLSRFAFDPAAGAGMTLKQAAADARASVDGIEVVSASNELTGVVDGLTLRLRQVTTAPVDIGVERDSSAAKAAIEAFVGAYNELAKYLAEQTKFDPATKVGGPLQGDSAAGALQRQLRGVLNAPSAASAAYPRLSDLGLELQRNGTLSIDEPKLSAALANPAELQKAWAQRDPVDATRQGFARRYAELASQVLGLDGSVTTRTEGLRQRISQNSDKQERLNDRVERFQQRLVAQYTVMDSNLSRLNALGAYVSQQLASIAKTDTGG